MDKTFAIKSLIVLVVLSLVYSVFWFFKTGQTEKQVSNFISENSAYISAGEVAVSGFPLSQKVTIEDLKFTIPNPAFSQYQVVVKHLEADSGIFNNNFSISIFEQVTVQDSDNNSNAVEFAKNPEISLSVIDGVIAKFTYKDSGYKILDSEKNVVYAATGSVVTFDSTAEDAGKIKNKITVNIKDIEGFDIMNIYKNAAEKRVIEGIKTGEISIGSGSAPVVEGAPVAPDSTVVASTEPAKVETPPTVLPVVAEGTAVMAAPALAPVANPADAVVKSNFVLDVDYVLTPTNQGDQNQQITTDPSQIQETPVQYSKAVTINSLEFSNPTYKITVNGQMNSFQDDNLPSGAVTVTFENVSHVVSHVVTGLNQIVEQRKSGATDVQTADLTSPNPAGEDSYQAFLKKLATNLSAVTKELAQKNQLSKDDVAVFDVRREKNIEFLVNETSSREILGKF